MIKAISVMAALAIATVTQALAQQQYPPDNSTSNRRSYDQDQQARTPDPNTDRPGTVETLRERGMSSPNVQGEAVPESPATGVPEPQGRDDPKRLESVPRP